MQKRNNIIIGDLIIDEYINCDPLGMSQEDPTLVVTPVESKKFIGGAGIVASHAASLGAKTSIICSNMIACRVCSHKSRHII